jgi:hypothetical protein
MSFISAAVRKVAPSNSTGITLVSGAAVNTYGSWVTIIAATSGIVHVSGVNVGLATGATGDIEFGYGTVGSEVPIGFHRFEIPNPGNQRDFHTFSIPIGPVPSGARLAARYRGAVSHSIGIKAHYFEALDSGHVGSSERQLRSLPFQDVTVTPSGTSWAWSAWYQLSASLPTNADIVGVEMRGWAGEWYEYQLGTGLPGAETPLTTMRASRNGDSATLTLQLSRPYPLPLGTAVSFRVRKSGTTTAARSPRLIYYSGSPEIPDIIQPVLPMQRASYIIFSNAVTEKQIETRLTKTYLQVLASDTPSPSSPVSLSLTTINGNLYDQEGNVITFGKLTFRPRGFLVVDGQLIGANAIEYTITGFITINLAPSNGVLYDVEYDPYPADTETPNNMKPGYFRDVWNIPSTGPVDLADL